jgi:hypothetical protein
LLQLNGSRAFSGSSAIYLFDADAALFLMGLVFIYTAGRRAGRRGALCGVRWRVAR